jgi:uncharacterized MAPEG superfamily protein
VITWILAVLVLFVVQTFLPATLRYVQSGVGAAASVRIALGPRDEVPPLSPVGARAQRALANIHEALPVFLTLALLHVARSTAGDTATHGAAVFVVARAIYVPAYLSGITGLRSAAWTVSWVGLVMMIVALRGA